MIERGIREKLSEMGIDLSAMYRSSRGPALLNLPASFFDGGGVLWVVLRSPGARRDLCRVTAEELARMRRILGPYDVNPPRDMNAAKVRNGGPVCHSCEGCELQYMELELFSYAWRVTEFEGKPAIDRKERDGYEIASWLECWDCKTAQTLPDGWEVL